METKNIRIEAGQELYEALLEEQEKRREQNGKKTSLGEIIIETCRKRFLLNSDENENDQISTAIDQKIVKKDAAIIHQMLENRLKMIKTLEEYLSAREEAIMEREQDFTERFEHLQMEKDKFFQDKTAFLDQKLKSQNSSLDGIIESRISHEMDTKELALKTDQLREQKEQIKYLQTQLEKSQLQSEKGSSLMDKLMPFLPTIAAIAGMFLINRKFDQKNDQDPLKMQINKVLKTLDPEHMDLLMSTLKEALEQFSNESKGNDQKSTENNEKKK